MLNARLKAVFDRASTATLIQSLKTLDEIPARTAEEGQALIWMIEELERRYPEADAAVEAAFDAAGVSGEVDYVAVLLANIPA